MAPALNIGINRHQKGKSLQSRRDKQKIDTDPDSHPIDARANLFDWLRHQAIGSCLITSKDKVGQALNSSDTYRLRVRANRPAEALLVSDHL
jgi:hypothetical protein